MKWNPVLHLIRFIRVDRFLPNCSSDKCPFLLLFIKSSFFFPVMLPNLKTENSDVRSCLTSSAFVWDIIIKIALTVGLCSSTYRTTATLLNLKFTLQKQNCTVFPLNACMSQLSWLILLLNSLLFCKVIKYHCNNCALRIKFLLKFTGTRK